MPPARAARTFIRPALHVALAHHPLCTHFGLDVFRVGPLKLCRGCAVAIPTFVLGAAAGLMALRSGVVPPVLVVVAALLGAPQLVTYARRLAPGPRIIVKAAGGFGLALLLLGVITAPVAWSWRIGALVGLGLVFVSLQAVRAHQVLSTCRRCPWKMDWDHCPGLGGL